MKGNSAAVVPVFVTISNASHRTNVPWCRNRLSRHKKCFEPKNGDVGDNHMLVIAKWLFEILIATMLRQTKLEATCPEKLTFFLQECGSHCWSASIVSLFFYSYYRNTACFQWFGRRRGQERLALFCRSEASLNPLLVSASCCFPKRSHALNEASRISSKFNKMG